MGTRISMVGYDKLIQVQNNAGMRQMDTPEATEYFEAGMIEVLREVAVKRLLEIESKRPDYPKEYDELVEEQAGIYDKIRAEMPEDREGLISALEDVDNRIGMYESDRCFIEGFIEGYRFVRATYSSYGSQDFKIR